MPVSLIKDSLIPGQIYNVSVNFKDDSKTIDNLRFFQSKLPNVFTSSLAPYNTLSTIENQVSRSDRTNDDGTEPGTRNSNISNVKVVFSRAGGYPSRPTPLDCAFTIKIASGAPATMFVITGITDSDFKFLNDYSGVKQSGVIEIKIFGSELAPDATWDTTVSPQKFKGSKSGILNNLINFPKAGKNIAGVVNYYGGSYKPPSVTSTYTRSSSIRTNIRNPSILESLYWDENVKDYVHFFISSKSTGPWYYFKSSADIVAASADRGSITGNQGTFSKDGPKAIATNAAEFAALDKDYVAGARCKFFQGNHTNNENFGIPNVYVRFAIARYVLEESRVTSQWLPGNGTESKILSTTEQLDGY